MASDYLPSPPRWCACLTRPKARLHHKSNVPSGELHPRSGLKVLVRRFVLVLVVVLVLDSLRAECWSTGVSAYCTFSELRPRSGLEVLSGRILRCALPRVKTLGCSVSRFAIGRPKRMKHLAPYLSASIDVHPRLVFSQAHVLKFAPSAIMADDWVCQT